MFHKSTPERAGLVQFDDYKFQTMLTTALEEAPFLGNTQFVSNKVLRILEYDRENNTQFFQTLCTYLDSNLNYKDTAEAMFVHRNTVIYRIQRMKELLNIDFDSADVRFNLQVSCRIIRSLSDQESI